MFNLILKFLVFEIGCNFVLILIWLFFLIEEIWWELLTNFRFLFENSVIFDFTSCGILRIVWEKHLFNFLIWVFYCESALILILLSIECERAGLG